MAGEEKNLDSVLFEQIDEALEERGGGDRRKKNVGSVHANGEDRRKGDRRDEES